MSWEDAAAVPEAFVTAHDALVTQAAMRTGERVLVHAVGSGVGLAASQLIRALGGTCYGTARSADKIERARAFGLTDGIVVGDDLAVVAAAVKRWTNGEGVSVILDLVGGPYLPVNVECCASTGRIILIGLLAGRSATLNLGSVLNRRVTIRGTVLRARTDAEKAAVTAVFVRDVLPLLERGAVRPVVERVFPLAQIADAHTLLESNRTFGKVVLTH
jgi:NADPH:quinone reductase-like Zn-dependent oxidoreductase